MNEKQLFRSTWIKWAAIYGVTTLALQVLFGLLGLYSAWMMMMSIGLLVTIGLVVMALKAYKEGNNGYMKYGRSVGLGAMTGLFGGLIAGLLLAFYIGVVNPGMIDDLKKASIESTTELNEKWNLGMTEDQIYEQTEERVTLKGTIIQNLIFGPIGGVIFAVLIALVAGAIMKNDPPEGYVENMDIDEIGQG